MISVENLRKVFPTRAVALVVLDGVYLEVGPGESVAIMGPSGSGKSTLLHILGTLDTPTSGKVRLGEQDPFALSEDERARFRNKEIGFVFQDHHMLPQCSALENVLTPTLVRKENRAGAAERAKALLERVGLAKRMDYRPGDLSGGERQRVAIARALINGPRILLCDEPTGNLDQETGASVAECFVELQRNEGVALVVATHNPGFAACFDRVLRLGKGKLEGEEKEKEKE